MGRAMLSKYLIQFSVEGWGCVPSLLFDLRQIMKIMATSFKRSHARAAILSAPSPAAGHRRPTPPQRLLDTHGQVWVSLLWGHLSWYTQVMFVPCKSLFPLSCVSSGGSMVGLTATSSKRAYAIPSLLHPEPLPLQKSTADPYFHRIHSNTVLSQSLWDLWLLVHTRFV